MIVLDGSAAVERLCGGKAAGLVGRWLLAEPPLHAPQRLDLEVASVLRRQCALKRLTPERAREALALTEALGATLLTMDRALAGAKFKQGRVVVVDTS